MTKTLASALSEIKKRAESATPGPCEVVRFDHGSGAISYQVESGFGKNHVVLGSHNDLDNPKAKADATFDAMSRQDIPALLRVIERLIQQRDTTLGLLNDNKKAVDVVIATANREILSLLNSPEQKEK